MLTKSLFRWRLFVVLVGLLAGPVAAEELDLPTCEEPRTATARVIRALDGDTIETSQGVVRLAGIEAPHGFGFGDPEQADTARITLNGLVKGKAIAIAALGEQPDRYGRTHAHVFMEDGQWLQAVLVDLGMVRVRPLAGEEACLSPLVGAEATARAAERGVWAGGINGPLPADDSSLSRKIGLYAIVEGRILSVGYGSVMVFLDFGHNYRRDFTVMIPKRLQAQFAEAGMPVATFEGRLVRVRGMIEESGGPAIRLQSPAAIELLDE